MSEKQVILGFCEWLTNQGCEYETLNYGSEEDIEKLVDTYLREGED